MEGVHGTAPWFTGSKPVVFLLDETPIVGGGAEYCNSGPGILSKPNVHASHSRLLERPNDESFNVCPDNFAAQLRWLGTTAPTPLAYNCASPLIGIGGSTGN